MSYFNEEKIMVLIKNIIFLLVKIKNTEIKRF